MPGWQERIVDAPRHHDEGKPENEAPLATLAVVMSNHTHNFQVGENWAEERTRDYDRREAVGRIVGEQNEEEEE